MGSADRAVQDRRLGYTANGFASSAEDSIRRSRWPARSAGSHQRRAPGEDTSASATGRSSCAATAARPQILLLRREVPVVPTPVVAQCWCGTPRQALLARVLAGCHVEPLDDLQARATGTLAGRAQTTDIVDARVVEGALRRRDLVIGSDPGDLRAMAAATGHQLEVDHP